MSIIFSIALCLGIFESLSKYHGLGGPYGLWSGAKVEMLNPSQQPSRWLRELAEKRYGLYLQLGVEFPNATYVIGPDVELRPDLLFGLGRASGITRATTSSFDDFGPAECQSPLTADNLGGGELLFSGADEGIGNFLVFGCPQANSRLVVTVDASGVVFQSVEGLKSK